jgi:hypothetical protein
MENGILVKKACLNISESKKRIKEKPFKIKITHPSREYSEDETPQERYRSIIEVEQSSKELTETTSHKNSNDTNEIENDLSILISKNKIQTPNLMEESMDYKMSTGSYNEEMKGLIDDKFDLMKLNDKDLIKKMSK